MSDEEKRRSMLTCVVGRGHSEVNLSAQSIHAARSPVAVSYLTWVNFTYNNCENVSPSTDYKMMGTFM